MSAERFAWCVAGVAVALLLLAILTACASVEGPCSVEVTASAGAYASAYVCEPGGRAVVFTPGPVAHELRELEAD